MGQSVHPVAFRIPYIRRWKTLYFPSSLNNSNLFNDLQIKNYLENVYFFNKYLIDDPIFVREGKTLKIFYQYFLRKIKLKSSFKDLKKKQKKNFLNKKKFNSIKNSLYSPHLNLIKIKNLLLLINNLKNLYLNTYNLNLNNSLLPYNLAEKKVFLNLKRSISLKQKIINLLKNKDISLDSSQGLIIYNNILLNLSKKEINNQLYLKKLKLGEKLKKLKIISNSLISYLKFLLNTQKLRFNNLNYFLLLKNKKNIIKYNLNHLFISSFFKRKKKVIPFKITRFINSNFDKIFLLIFKKFIITLKNFKFLKNLDLINNLKFFSKLKNNQFKNLFLPFQELLINLNYLINILQNNNLKFNTFFNKYFIKLLFLIKNKNIKNIFFFNQNSRNFFKQKNGLKLNLIKRKLGIKFNKLKNLLIDLKKKKINIKSKLILNTLNNKSFKRKKYEFVKKYFLLKKVSQRLKTQNKFKKGRIINNLKGLHKQRINKNWKLKKNNIIKKKGNNSFFSHPILVSSMSQKRKFFYNKYPFIKNKKNIFYKTHPSLMSKKRYLYKNLFMNSANNILNKFSMLKKKKFKIKRKIYLNNLQNKIKNNLQLLALSKVQIFAKPCDTFSGIPLTNATILAKLLAHLFKYHRRFYHRFLDRMFKIVKAFKIVSGLKIIFTGRTGSSARSKQFTFKYGRIPNQTLNAQIDYSFIKVLDKLGISGFKVWIYFNNY